MKVDFKLELVPVPVSDVDQAKEFYVEKVGFNADEDHVLSDELRFVQLTPPGSACSISIGKGLTQMAPGSLEGLQLVVSDIEEARRGPGRKGRGGVGGSGLPLGTLRLLRRSRRQQVGRSAARRAVGAGWRRSARGGASAH